MDMEIDKTGSDNEIAAVNLINFEVRISPACNAMRSIAGRCDL